MKINAIKFTPINQTKLNNNRQVLKSNSDFFEPSFGARIKHSAEFLEVTKEAKEMRNFITNTCLLDEKGKLIPEAERKFIELAKSTYGNDKDKKEFLNTITLSLKATMDSGDSQMFPFFMGNIEAMYMSGFSHKEIQDVFNWDGFDIETPKAFIILKEIYEDKMSDVDKKLFLSRYCKDKNGVIDTNRIPEILRIVKAFGIEDLKELDLAYAIFFDGNMEYDSKRCDFFYDTTKFLLNYCFYQDDNAKLMVQNFPSEFKNLIYIMLETIMDSTQGEDGKFDPQKAQDSFSTWFDYAKNNRDELNKMLEIKVYNKQYNDYEYLTLEKCINKNPQEAYFVDNIIYRLSCLIANSAQNFH